MAVRLASPGFVPRGKGWARVPKEEGSDCTSERHGASEAAFRKGCRCSPAVKAHQQFIDVRREHRQAVRAEGRAAGRCLADIHGTETAIHHGCICVRKRDFDLARQARRPKPAMTQAERRRHTAFRGPSARVSPWNLFLLLHGVVDQPSQAERMVAVLTLSRRGNRAGTGLMDNTEIAQRLGVDPATISRDRGRVVKLREQRDLRRYLDAKARAEKVAAAIARQEARRG